MTGIRLLGKDGDRRLYAGPVSGVGEWPSELDEPFVALTALDAERRSDDELRDLARALLDRGCIYACAWGPGASKVEDAFDAIALEAEVAGRPYVDDVVMTTSHEDESLDEALWFAVFTAFPASGEAAAAVVAVSDAEWHEQIEVRLADPHRLDADVLARDEGES